MPELSLRIQLPFLNRQLPELLVLRNHRELFAYNQWLFKFLDCILNLGMFCCFSFFIFLPDSYESLTRLDSLTVNKNALIF
jgi:hypothetical protein